MITDKTKAPKNLHYSVTNNCGSIFKNFGKNQNEAYKFALDMDETAIIRGFYVFKRFGKWEKNTIFIDHIFKDK